MNDQIMALEKQYWNGMETHNYDTVKNLTHFPCIIAGKDGVRSVNEPEFKTMFESGANVSWKILDLSGGQVQQLNNDTAIIAYQVTFENPAKGGGEPVTCVCSSTWVKENDRWVCALHTECALEKKEGE